jgi:hypothetical protein
MLPCIVLPLLGRITCGKHCTCGDGSGCSNGEGCKPSAVPVSVACTTSVSDSATGLEQRPSHDTVISVVTVVAAAVAVVAVATLTAAVEVAEERLVAAPLHEGRGRGTAAAK